MSAARTSSSSAASAAAFKDTVRKRSNARAEAASLRPPLAPRALQILNVGGGAREEVVRFRKRAAFNQSAVLADD